MTTTSPLTTTTTSAQAQATVNSGLSSIANNYQTFLSLLTTQLSNQDPLSPMDTSQFTQQLTQMTGVEQQLLSNQLLQQLVNQNNAADALPHFDKALAIDPNYVDAHVGRAEARRMLDQYDLSLPDCTSVIRINPEDPRGYNCRGLTRKSAKNYDAAIADFTQAIKLNPRFVAAYFDRANTYTDQKQYTEAIRDYTEGLRLRPRNPEYHLRRAKAYADLKQFDKAIEDYSDVIRAEPNNLRALRGRALAEDGIGDAAGAAADRKSANAAQKARKRG